MTTKAFYVYLECVSWISESKMRWNILGAICFIIYFALFPIGLEILKEELTLHSKIELPDFFIFFYCLHIILSQKDYNLR